MSEVTIHKTGKGSLVLTQEQWDSHRAELEPQGWRDVNEPVKAKRGKKSDAKSDSQGEVDE